METNTASRLGGYLLFAAAVAGLILAIYDFYTPLTGVNGTAGALVTIAASALIAILTLLVVMPARLHPLWVAIIWRVVILLLLAGCCFAGLLLHERWLCIAMIVGAFGLCVNAFAPYVLPRRSRRGAARA